MRISVLISVILSILFVMNSHAQSSTLIENNEASAIAALGEIIRVQATYSSAFSNSGSFGKLSRLRPLLHESLVKGKSCGYRFKLTLYNNSSPKNYIAMAIPLKYGETGRHSFYTNASGVIRGIDSKGKFTTTGGEPVENCFNEFTDECIVDTERGRLERNEKMVISSLRGLPGAQATYMSTLGLDRYGSLKQLSDAGLIGGLLAQGKLCGYHVAITKLEPKTSESNASFEIIATPIEYGKTGRRSFYVDEAGVLRGADNGGKAANINDKPIQQ